MLNEFYSSLPQYNLHVLDLTRDSSLLRGAKSKDNPSYDSCMHPHFKKNVLFSGYHAVKAIPYSGCTTWNRLCPAVKGRHNLSVFMTSGNNDGQQGPEVLQSVRIIILKENSCLTKTGVSDAIFNSYYVNSYLSTKKHNNREVENSIVTDMNHRD